MCGWGRRMSRAGQARTRMDRVRFASPAHTHPGWHAGRRLAHALVWHAQRRLAHAQYAGKYDRHRTAGHAHSVSGTTGPDKSGVMTCDAGGDGTMSRGTHSHDYSVSFVTPWLITITRSLVARAVVRPLT